MSILEISDIQHRFRKFSNGVRVSMLINRGIMNNNKGSKRWVNKIISTDSSEWINAINILMDFQKHLNDPDIRLYSCVNSRNIDKAIAMFKHKQIDLQDNMKLKFYTKLNDAFSSCLMQPENKLTKYFLLDVDTKDTSEVDKFIYDNNISIYSIYPTKKGWHYIVLPFNVKLAEGFKTFCVQKDGLLLINYLQDSGMKNET